VGDVSAYPSTAELGVSPHVPTLWPWHPANPDSVDLAWLRIGIHIGSGSASVAFILADKVSVPKH
jgi:hypothetical protein